MRCLFVVELGGLVLRYCELPCVVHDRIEPVCNGENRAVLKLSPNGGLDEVVRLQVNSSCSFIQDQDPGFPQESSSQTHQLPLADAEDASSVSKTALMTLVIVIMII